MFNRLSTRQFRKIRKELDIYYNEHDVSRFYGLLEKLFSYNLDKIPYEEWKEFKLCFSNNSYDFISIELYKKYSKVFKDLSLLWDLGDLFTDYIDDKKELSEESFINGIRKYVLGNPLIYKKFDGTIDFNKIPEFIKTLNFNYTWELNNVAELMKSDNKTIIIGNNRQSNFVEALGIDNLKKLEQETKIFSLPNTSHTFSDYSSLFYIICNNISSSSMYKFKDGSLSYEEFKVEFVNLLDEMRMHGSFNNLINYDGVEGKFREEHPEIFMDKSAPIDLKNTFYSRSITLSDLNEHKEYIPFLISKKLTEFKTIPSELVLDNNETENFLDKYKKQYGEEKYLQLLSRFGPAISGISIVCTNEEFNNEEKLEKIIMEEVKDNIIESALNHEYLKENILFYNTYPELFVDFKEIDGIDIELARKLEKDYYNRDYIYCYINKYPQLIDVLKDKNLEIPFGGTAIENRITNPTYKHGSVRRSDLELKDMYGNEKFLKLCSLYGASMYNIIQYLKREIYIDGCDYYGVKDKQYKSFEEVKSIIESIITKLCIKGEKGYYENTPKFLKQQHPELFLSEYAPEGLKKCFYCYEGSSKDNLTFALLSLNKNWLPYLKGKSVSQAFIITSGEPHLIKEYFNLFGEYRGLILGIKKPETVVRMIKEDKVKLMKKWYDKTGGKFIPDYVIMQDINIDEADKFLSNTTNWNKLMKLEDFTKDLESKDALLKLAYSFGVFDNDTRGFNKLYELLTKIPNKLNRKESKTIKDLNNKFLTRCGYLFKEVKDIPNRYKIYYVIEHIKRIVTINAQDKNDYISFFEAIEKDKVNFDFSKSSFILQFYKTNNDGTITLNINQQKYPNVIKFLRNYLEKKCCNKKLLKPEKIHQLFGGFKLEYNPEFREFLLNNLDEILSNSDYQTYIGAIQKQFKNIKIANSNRKLTLDLAISYVQENKYEDVEDGNESVAEISSVAGYDQEDFETLQKIYNYGKQRVFSSIPRIENKTNKYNYEILRLDDPLALAIGTLTDCCQEIGNVAESCMEHSMVDKNGRVFVIRDKEGNIVSQSWVWRNKNVLCFDNIEIPDKAFDRVNDRKKLSQEVYEIYKKAAEELIEKDEEVYKKLFEESKITNEQYKGLKLSKVTVGIGYNDIASAIEKSTKKDNNLSEPLPFNELVELDRELYISDSRTQYILKETTNEGNYNGETIQLHNDLYQIYDDSNFTKKELIRLGKLEMLQDGYSEILEIEAEENLVSNIAELYELDKEKTKIIMNANFAIIYEDKNDVIKIGDLFYNTTAGDMNIVDVVVMQIRLAIDQIKGNKKIDASNLEKDQEEIYNKAINLSKELNVEKGLKIR